MIYLMFVKANPVTYVMFQKNVRENNLDTKYIKQIHQKSKLCRMDICGLCCSFGNLAKSDLSFNDEWQLYLGDEAMSPFLLPT